jgi:hypothetical protein
MSLTGAEGGASLDCQDRSRHADTPALVRRYVKASFVFLISGLVLGGYIAVAQFGVGIYPPRLSSRRPSTCCSSASSAAA